MKRTKNVLTVYVDNIVNCTFKMHVTLCLDELLSIS